MTSSLNQRTAQIAIDGSRGDVQAWLTPRASLLLAVCLGRVATRGAPMQSAHDAIWEWDRRRVGRCIEQPSLSRMAGCDAVTYALERGNGEVLREWKFEREGWLFGAGILLRQHDRRSAESLGLKSLATWEWILGTQTSVVPPAPVGEVSELAESVVVNADPRTVWSLIRHVENNRLLHANYLDAFKVPGTPDGVGEEQSVVLQFPRARMTFTSVLLEEVPFVRLVTRSWGRNDPHDRQTYTLECVNGGTRLTICFRFSAQPGAETLAHESAYREGIRDYLSRVAGVLASGWTDDRPTFCDGT